MELSVKMTDGATLEMTGTLTKGTIYLKDYKDDLTEIELYDSAENKSCFVMLKEFVSKHYDEETAIKFLKALHTELKKLHDSN